MEVLGDILERGALVYPDREAMVFKNTRLTYRELNDRVNRLANYLLSLNLAGSKHVAVLAENCHQYAEVYFAAAKAGHVTVPLNYRLSTREMAEIITDAEVKVLFFGKSFASQAGELAEKSGFNSVICFDDRQEGCRYYEELLEGFPGTNPGIEVDENQMAILMYTGGTTGRPKGVMLSHRNLMTTTYDNVMLCNLDKESSTCFILPFFHIAWWPVPTVLFAGGKVVVLERPDLTEILRLIQDEKCRHINSVPTIYNWLLMHPELEKYDLSSLKMMSYAGSPIAPELLKKLISKFGDIFYQGYGLTEAAPTLTNLLPEDHIVEGPPELTRRLKSCGRQSNFPRVRVVTADGRDVRPKEVGEIIARGKNVMLGYWKNPEQTAKTIRNGWLHTGDMGTVDEDGYIYLVDRKNDMIITGGENVYPREVEDVLYEHPAVMEATVFGVPDHKWGESVKAVVVLKAGMDAGEDELIQFCKARLAGYKCPKSVEFRGSVPKSLVGKILRNEVKKDYWQGMDRTIS
ncbi:MAG: class I adenylate-forming enzyme family protein [Bacillota bacterium]